MKKLFYLLFFIPFTVCSQTVKINENIQNSKTAAHINVPGTRLYMIPPPGFVIGKGFAGFAKGQTSLINVMDLAGGNMETNAATYSREKFEKNGIKVFDYKEMKVNGFSAKYAHVQGEGPEKVYNIVFGDTSFSTMIMAVYPGDDEKLAGEMISSLNTIYYDKKKEIDPFEKAGFSLDNTASKYKFSEFTGNMYIYKNITVENEDRNDTSVVIATEFPAGAGESAESTGRMMENKLYQAGFTNVSKGHTGKEPINGYETFWTELTGDMKGKPMGLFICVAVHNGKAVMLQAISNKRHELNLEEFKKLAKSLIIK